jgi:hypothetical protein
MMKVEQKRFLDKRLREHAKVQPEIRELKRILLKLGGDHLVAPPEGPEDILGALVQSGYVMHGPVKPKLMERSACHLNTSRLWLERKQGVVAIGTGFALNDDGLWRRHSWGIRRDGLVETTCPREKYFGIALWGGMAEGFAREECHGGGLVILHKVVDPKPARMARRDALKAA